MTHTDHIEDDEGHRWHRQPDGTWHYDPITIGGHTMTIVTTWDKLQTILPKDTP